MPRRPTVNPEQMDRLIAMREKGRSYDWIGGALGVKKSAVAWQCLKHGITSPKAPAMKPSGPVIVKRGRQVVRRFTPDEDRRLLAYARQGLAHVEIGRLTDRRCSSVAARLMTLARHEASQEGEF